MLRTALSRPWDGDPSSRGPAGFIAAFPDLECGDYRRKTQITAEPPASAQGCAPRVRSIHGLFLRTYTLQVLGRGRLDRNDAATVRPNCS